MTREEAIDWGEMWLEVHEDSKDSNTYEFVNVAIKALEQTRWIPVSERLPKESGYYLTNVFIEDCYFSEVCVRWFAHPDDYITTAGEWRECADDELVTAWMPLPEHYKAESEDKE